MLTNILLVLLLVNTWTFMMFGWDKICAETGRWRVSEASLLGLAFIGGTAGAYLARSVFRHKTRKQPFSEYLNYIAALQACASVAALVFLWPG